MTEEDEPANILPATFCAGKKNCTKHEIVVKNGLCCTIACGTTNDSYGVIENELSG